jgi:large subunit ribosomal protein L20
MARVKRGVSARRRHKQGPQSCQGLLRCPPQGLSRRQAGRHQGRSVQLPRPPPAQADFRSLWIVRINAAAREHGLSYSRFINGLKRAESRDRPQGAGRPGGPRQGCVQGAGRKSPGQPGLIPGMSSPSPEGLLEEALGLVADAPTEERAREISLDDVRVRCATSARKAR